MHHTAEAVIVVDRIVQRAAIVPERQRADAPIEAAGKFRLGLVLKQEIEQRRTLGFGHILETHRVADIYVKRLSSGFRMRTDHWMLADIFFLRFSLAAVAQPRAYESRPPWPNN